MESKGRLCEDPQVPKMFMSFFRTHNRLSIQASSASITPLSTCGGMSGKSSMSSRRGCHVLRYQGSPNLSISYQRMIYGIFLIYVQQGFGGQGLSCFSSRFQTSGTPFGTLTMILTERGNATRSDISNQKVDPEVTYVLTIHVSWSQDSIQTQGHQEMQSYPGPRTES